MKEERSARVVGHFVVHDGGRGPDLPPEDPKEEIAAGKETTLQESHPYLVTMIKFLCLIAFLPELWGMMKRFPARLQKAYREEMEKKSQR